MSSLPSYVSAAKPVPWASRAPWYKTIAPTYAGIMLWFVFWQELAVGGGAPGGILASGIGPAFLGLILAAVICHFFFYMAPAMLGMRTGLPLYVVGTSTYGTRGGLIMPGFLMGLLQFGWLAVNSSAVAVILCKCFGVGTATNSSGAVEVQIPGMAHGLIAGTFAILAAFVGLKGIQYVAKVATYLPLIPIAVLLILLAVTWHGLGNFDINRVISAQMPPQTFQMDEQYDEQMGMEEMPIVTSAKAPLGRWAVVGFLCTYIVGFFATAGAAGADIAANSRNDEDVHIGGLTGIVLPTVLAGEAVLLIIAGAYGVENLIQPENLGSLNPINLMPDLIGVRMANIAMIALAISSFPPACFSAFIAANSFKTTMPKVNPYLSVGLGTAVSVFLAVSGIAGNVVGVFVVIGASFGPVCGAMLADFLLSGRKWSGPRAGFNPAGWISWAVGFVIGSFNLVVETAVKQHWQWAYNAFPTIENWQGYVPVPPVSALVVGFVLYLLLALVGFRTKVLEMPATPA